MNHSYLEKLPQDSYRLVRKIGVLADERNVSVCLVGGTVRDLMLKKPHLDLDFVIEDDAIDFAAKAGKLLKAGRIKIHKDFKTAALTLKNGIVLDFATCRAESYPEPGMLPRVRPGTLREDLLRRDFSINAMALRINKARWNELVDPFNGLKDLRAKRIRVLHERSFIDDPTRILRAIRFEQRFRFHMEPVTLKLLKDRLADRANDRTSEQRFFNEFMKMLSEQRPQDGLKRCRELRAERLLHAQMTLNLKTFNIVHKRVLAVSQEYDLTAEDRRKMSTMALLEGWLPGARLEFLAKLSLSAQDRKSFEGIDAAIDFLPKLCQNLLSSSAVFQRLQSFTREQCLYLCCRTSNRTARKRLNRFLKEDCFTKLRISGHDVRALGADGKQVGLMIQQTLNRKIDAGFSSKKEELDFVKHLMTAGD